MIECEVCRRYVNGDEIESCEVCGTELCEGCYQNHVKRCLNPEAFEEEY